MTKKIQPLIIGIAGGSGSGKTTVSENIAKIIGVGEMLTIIRHDDYYKDQSHLTMEERLKTNYDHPHAIDNNMLIADLLKLKQNQAIEKPIYDFVHHTRATECEIIMPTSIIILEGILTLAEASLRELLDIKVFVHTPADIRFIRRLKRDVQERGRDLDSVIDQYLNVVRVMHEQFVEPSKEFADIIIPMGGANSVAIDLLATKIYRTHEQRIQEG